MGDPSKLTPEDRAKMALDAWLDGTERGHLHDADVLLDLIAEQITFYAEHRPSLTLPSRYALANIISQVMTRDSRALALRTADAILALFTPPEPAPKPSLDTVEGVEEGR